MIIRPFSECIPHKFFFSTFKEKNFLLMQSEKRAGGQNKHKHPHKNITTVSNKFLQVCIRVVQ